MSQSHISQFSDNYSSSVVEDAPLDHLSFLPSDSAQSVNPDVLYGQNSASMPDLTFVRAPFAAPPPEILQRVGLPRKQNYVLWTDMVNDEFVAWWLKTEYGSRMNRNIFESKRQAECWQHFNQVAAIQDGNPKAHLSSQQTAFSHEAWVERIITFITSLQLPFQLVEHPQFRALIEMARLAPSLPEIPSSDTVRRRLHELVMERQQSLLQKLPTGGKLSIALDCWTSPFRQAFMAVTGYFIDQDWNYREILLGFEPLHGTHTGINLGTVLFQLFQKHQIEGRVLTVTTDNASNNSTLVESIKDSLQALMMM
ncbi:hypothetical protein PENANT_c251G09817 [Penicillium antarcticum]|uniref:HAT C-terminal dimerisation domain-containing protein n=1 Tax=Penicillium antarcticum TaxID=416450 RepID=A0A1V6P153_9EURO|nr:hypothetical protein PENANT_c251G09817 [Penicillium antarcticum]